jgi:hypothetical protein
MIQLQVNTQDVQRRLGAFRNQVPFVLATSINETLLLAQKAQRARQQQSFKIRNRTFMDRAVKISPFATKANPRGVLLIDPPGGQARASILTQHEEGGIKRASSQHGMGGSLWIPEPTGPTPARKIRSGVRGVPAGSGFRPRELGLKPHGTSGKVWQGANRTFLIRTADGRGIVLQRTRGSRRRATRIRTRKTHWVGRRSGVEVLYILTPNGRLQPRLHFEETVISTIQREWEPNVLQAIMRALATAR